MADRGTRGRALPVRAVLLAPSLAGVLPDGAASTGLPARMIDEVNRVRVEAGLRPL
jgi:hypothetical protein